MSTVPVIIQGGMGVGVSNWRLANAVSSRGQLGVVSGTALDVVFARRLQDGDPGGHMRRALAHFPSRAIADRLLARFYIEGGKAATRPYAPLPLHDVAEPDVLVDLMVAANFVEIWLAREGHGRPVGINYLEKIQLPHLASIYGAMLAGVDYVLMGAGIPFKIPGVLDRLVHHEPVTYPLHVTGDAAGVETMAAFDPASIDDIDRAPLKRPRFLAIVSSHVLAATLLKRANGVVDGFIVEGPTAGGHNAPPRGRLQLTTDGEPVYGERDVVDLEKMRTLERPFWLAGGYATAEKLAEARAAGAAGVQIGTAFACCDESGLREDYKRALLQEAIAGTARVFTDPLASPTSFPFKVAQLDGTLSDAAIYAQRPRVCDLGYLREAYRTPSGTVGFRCAAEPESAYLSKGGAPDDLVGRKCVCNALMAAIGLGQVRGKTIEPAIVTSGDDLAGVTRFLAPGATSYRADDVIDKVLGSPF
jgi:nitronate monooxygenase